MVNKCQSNYELCDLYDTLAPELAIQHLYIPVSYWSYPDHSTTAVTVPGMAFRQHAGPP
jgi:hypothetical protein